MGCWSSAGLVPGGVWSEVVAVGTMAGMWERGRGTSTAQDGCAALPPLPPLGTTALVTSLDSTGDAITQQPQPVQEQVATRSSLKEIPWKYQNFCAVARKGTEYNTGSQKEEQSCEENIEGIKLMSCHQPKTSSREVSVILGPSAAAWFPARYVFLLQGQETAG